MLDFTQLSTVHRTYHKDKTHDKCKIKKEIVDLLRSTDL